jgi:RES domain-containing protein
MLAYRISKARYAADPLGGAGGIQAGGRWHHKGVPVVYASQTLSLASLEFFVHFGRLESAIRLVCFEIGIPEGIVEDLDRSRLPADWRSVPPGVVTADMGTDWLRSRRSAVLRVPSALTEGEYNFLINPAHSDAGQVRVLESNPFSYDSRMWK